MPASVPQFCANAWHYITGYKT